MKWLMALAAILVMEILWFSYQFGYDLLGSSLSVAVGFSVVFVLVIRLHSQGGVGVLQTEGLQQRWPWLLLHGFTFVLSQIPLSVFGTSGEAFGEAFNVSSVWRLTARLAAGCVALAFWLLAVAPLRAWFRLVRAEQTALMVSVGAGVAIWLSEALVRDENLLQSFTDLTFSASRQLLSLIYPHAVFVPAQNLLGTTTFAVEIYPVCSGVEGIVLIVVFLTVYLWLFRRDLAFPRALLLYPLGIVVIWLANIVRVTALVLVGTWLSPEIAVRGFHSLAGWIIFTLIALALVGLSNRLGFSSGWRVADVQSDQGMRLATALLAPLLTLLATNLLTSAFSSGFRSLYPLGVVTTSVALWYFRSSYGPIRWTISSHSVAIGIGVFLMWLILEPLNEQGGAELTQSLAALPQWVAAVWVVCHVIGSLITVPTAEELAFRGYLIRKLVARDFELVQPGQFTWISFIGSSVLFGLLHNRWLAGTIAGMGFALALYRRGEIGDAVIAHMICNALIVVAILGFGKWSLWV